MTADKKLHGTPHAPWTRRYLLGRPGEPGSRVVEVRPYLLGSWEAVLLDTSSDVIGRVLERETIESPHQGWDEERSDEAAHRLLEL